MVGSDVVCVAVGCVLPGLEGRILRGQLETASQHVDLRQLDRGELGLKLEPSGLGSRVLGLGLGSGSGL